MDISESAKKAIHLAEKMSKKPVVIKYKTHEFCIGSANTTTDKSNPSIIFMDSSIDAETQNYIIVHECGHIIRAYENLPNGTEKAVGLNHKIAIPDLANRFHENHTEIPPNEFLFDIASKIYTNIIGIGLDIFVENWIFDNFPELREKQNSEYSKKIRNMSNFSKDALQNGAPYIIINSMLATNLAFIKILSRKNPILIPKNLLMQFVEDKSNFIVSQYDGYCSNNLIEDYKFIFLMADFLELDGWFSIIEKNRVRAYKI